MKKFSIGLKRGTYKKKNTPQPRVEREFSFSSFCAFQFLTLLINNIAVV
jgi:hypothetical protein